jgi:hypothetical protein
MSPRRILRGRDRVCHRRVAAAQLISRLFLTAAVRLIADRPLVAVSAIGLILAFALVIVSDATVAFAAAMVC